MNYLEAVDIVCMECHYLNEETCSECPVRKTADENSRMENKCNKNSANYDSYWKEPKNHLKLKAESFMWCLKHPIINLIRITPNIKVFNKIIDIMFSEDTIEKVFDYPSSYHVNNHGTLKLILMIITNSKFDMEVR